MPDGAPQVTPVWVDLSDGCIRVNTAEGRVKTKNMRRDPRVSLSVSDPDDPYHYVTVRGRVVDITEDGALEHNDLLAKKYMGLDVFPFDHSGQVRVVVTIAPEKVYEYRGPGGSNEH
jgi:PPOX class probable F420-dependent enzyme